MKKFDLHCDLLHYLALDSSRTPDDSLSRCSLTQLNEGGVSSQVLAIFSPTEKGSTQIGLKQTEIFKSLSSGIKFYYAFENASTFSEEEEPLTACLERFKEIVKQRGNPFYISLTWNTENRFGGGAHTQIGLKEDGKQLIDVLSTYNIPIDLSHTSDNLAYDILNYVDKKGYGLPIIASHSNFRTVKHAERNLPDELAIEIKNRKGLIGFNFVKPFVGEDPVKGFVAHFEHALKLGLEDVMCFGADFFCDADLPEEQRRKLGPYFYDKYGNSGVYESVLSLWRNHLGVKDELLKKICFENVERFILSNILMSDFQHKGTEKQSAQRL